MSQSLVLIILLAIVVLNILVVYLRRRSRLERSALPRSTSVDGSPPASTWAPPSYAGSAADTSGPALSISINLIQVAGDSLLVTWNAVNKGASPLQIQWGAPNLELNGGELRLLVRVAS